MRKMNPRVVMWLLRKLRCRKYNTRPLELKILHIAKGCGVSYGTARYTIDLMIENKIIEKWTCKIGGPSPYKVTRYREITQKLSTG